MMGEFPHVLHDSEGMVLTARIDASTQVYLKVNRWVWPILMAAITGSVGAILEAESILAQVGLNVAVSIFFTAAENPLRLTHKGNAVAESGTSKATSQGVRRLRKLSRFVFRATQAEVQERVRSTVQRQPWRGKGVAGATAFGLDVVGGLIATWLTETIADSLLNERSVGGASGLAFDSLWVSIPRSSLVRENDSGRRTFLVADMRVAKLNGQDAVDPRRGISEVEENDESDAYRALALSGTRPLLFRVEPGHEPPPVESGTACDQDLPGPSRTVDFRLHVGGDTPTVIPFVRTSLAAATRTTEEATARVRIDRRDTSVRMYLVDPVME